MVKHVRLLHLHRITMEKQCSGMVFTALEHEHAGIMWAFKTHHFRGPFIIYASPCAFLPVFLHVNYSLLVLSQDRCCCSHHSMVSRWRILCHSWKGTTRIQVMFLYHGGSTVDFSCSYIMLIIISKPQTYPLHKVLLVFYTYIKVEPYQYRKANSYE